MNFLEIKRPVLIKVIVTEKFKNQMLSESHEAIASIEKDIAALQNASGAAPDVEKQIEYLKSMKQEFLAKIDDFEKVGTGQTLAFRTVEGITQIKSGDNLFEKLTKAEVVIKDWIVQEIIHP